MKRLMKCSTYAQDFGGSTTIQVSHNRPEVQVFGVLLGVLLGDENVSKIITGGRGE
jgi:hypothetical protein